MTMLYPVVLETEDSGAVSAYVPGLPVYAAAETHAKAEHAIRRVLTEYLNAHPAPVGAPRRLALREPMAGLVVALAQPPPEKNAPGLAEPQRHRSANALQPLRAGAPPADPSPHV